LLPRPPDQRFRFFYADAARRRHRRRHADNIDATPDPRQLSISLMFAPREMLERCLMRRDIIADTRATR